MSDKAQRPKLELPTNIPVHVEIKYPPYNGEGKDYGYGLTYKYTVIHEGAEKTWFVSDDLYPQVKDFPKGSKIVIVKKEEKNQQGKTYTKIEVHGELFDEHGRVQKEPPPQADLTDEKYRKDRKNAIYAALVDAASVVEKFNSECSPAFILGPEDVRTIAIHLNIGFEREKK